MDQQQFNRYILERALEIYDEYSVQPISGRYTRGMEDLEVCPIAAVLVAAMGKYPTIRFFTDEFSQDELLRDELRKKLSEILNEEIQLTHIDEFIRWWDSLNPTDEAAKNTIRQLLDSRPSRKTAKVLVTA